MDFQPENIDDKEQLEFRMQERARKRARLIQDPSPSPSPMPRPSPGTVDDDGDVSMADQPASRRQSPSRQSPRRSEASSAAGSPPDRELARPGSPERIKDLAARATPKDPVPDLSLVKLRRPGSSGVADTNYWGVEVLSVEQRGRLQMWMHHWQNGNEKYKEDFRRWFTDLLNFEDHCCGCRLITRRASVWAEKGDTNLYACRSCRSKKSPSNRPCLRLRVSANGEKIIEVMPERGKGAFDDPADAYDYWGPPQMVRIVDQ
jgi:hypothetical protein